MDGSGGVRAADEHAGPRAGVFGPSGCGCCHGGSRESGRLPRHRLRCWRTRPGCPQRCRCTPWVPTHRMTYFLPGYIAHLHSLLRTAPSMDNVLLLRAGAAHSASAVDFRCPPTNSLSWVIIEMESSVTSSSTSCNVLSRIHFRKRVLRLVVPVVLCVFPTRISLMVRGVRQMHTPQLGRGGREGGSCQYAPSGRSIMPSRGVGGRHGRAGPASTFLGGSPEANLAGGWRAGRRRAGRGCLARPYPRRACRFQLHGYTPCQCLSS